MTPYDLIQKLSEFKGDDRFLPIAFDINDEYHWSTIPYAVNGDPVDGDPADTVQIHIRVDPRYSDGNPIEIRYGEKWEHIPTGRRFVVIELK